MRAQPHGSQLSSHNEGRSPCRKQAVADGLRTFHSGKLDFAELGRRGGQARRKKPEERAGDKLEGLAHLALEELLTNAPGARTPRGLRLTPLPRGEESSPAIPERRRAASGCPSPEDGAHRGKPLGVIELVEPELHEDVVRAPYFVFRKRLQPTVHQPALIRGKISSQKIGAGRCQ